MHPNAENRVSLGGVLVRNEGQGWGLGWRFFSSSFSLSFNKTD